MAPPSAIKGDLLCILFGGETPYVLRPSSSEGYQLVGEAYAHRLMNADAMTALGMKVLSEEAFDLR